LTITSFASSTNPKAGWVKRRSRTCPYITNLRLDPFERTGWPGNGTKDGAQQYFDWFKFQFWRFVFVQQVMGKGNPDLP
jgi:arylsulfatase